MNIESVKAVIKTTLKQRQLIILSATITQQTIQKANEIMKPDVVNIAMKNTSVPKEISHYYIVAERRQKFVVLRKILAAEKPQKVIVFLNNAENIAVTVDKLCYHGLKADGIYGKAYKTERQYAIEKFRQGNINILVSSDIGARGLDIEGVTHIINMDIPEEPSYYLHRAGRTGRKGQHGKVISIVTPYETKWIKKYQKVWNISFEQKEMSFGKLTNSSNTKQQKPYTKNLKNNKKQYTKINKGGNHYE